MTYQWIIFDADGTLFDYDAAEKEALQKTFLWCGHNYQPGDLDYYRRVNKEVWIAFEQNQISIDQLKIRRFELLLDYLSIKAGPAEFSDYYLSQLSLETQLIEGTEELLSKLERHINLLLMTNGIKEVQRSRLKHSTIGHYFSDIVISDEVGYAKPDQKIFEIAMQKMSYPNKNQVLMVGDNLSSDIKGASDFGLPACWYNPRCLSSDNTLNPTYEIQHLSELYPILNIM